MMVARRSERMLFGVLLQGSRQPTKVLECFSREIEPSLRLNRLVAYFPDWRCHARTCLGVAPGYNRWLSANPFLALATALQRLQSDSRLPPMGSVLSLEMSKSDALEEGSTLRLLLFQTALKFNPFFVSWRSGDCLIVANFQGIPLILDSETT